jgi:tRNA A-37 threonylcarbamoyl transferase component Bud32
MTTLFESFFDDNESKDFKLWQHSIKNFALSSVEPLYSGQLLKFSVSQRTWKLRKFELTPNWLVYYKEEPGVSQNQHKRTPKGFLFLDWCRVHFVVQNSEKELRFGIRIIKNKKYTDLWAQTLVELEDWKRVLSNYTIQSDFHKKYTALKVIGKGSFARVNPFYKVYLVQNIMTKERFAVKAFSKDNLLAQAKGKESLMNEIEVMRQLNHENIMRLEEVHESENSIYLILELMEGGELINYVTRHQSLKMRELMKIMSDLMEALAYMDQQGIMHRDLKPENMILKLADSKQVSSSSSWAKPTQTSRFRVKH